MSRKPGAKPHGQIRRSQIITTFGPGSMVDLPNHAVLIAGLDHWSRGGEEIVELRLVEKLQRLLSVPALKLYSPPPDEDNPAAPPTGILRSAAVLRARTISTGHVDAALRDAVSPAEASSAASPVSEIAPERDYSKGISTTPQEIGGSVKRSVPPSCSTVAG